MSKDAIYNKNTVSPVQITREHYPARGSGINTLGYVIRAFKGSTDFTIWDAASGGTQLVEDTDYTLQNVDSALTSEAGFNVYTGYQIINASYQNVNLFFTYKVITSAIDGPTWKDDRLKDFERQSIVDCNFRSWEEGNSFTNPANDTYTATMFVAKRSGSTADSVVFSQATASAETGWDSTFKFTVTSVGTDAGTGLTGIEYRVEGYEKLIESNVVFRIRCKVPDTEKFRLVIDYGTGTEEETFIGFGEWQDAFITTTIPAGATQIYVQFLIRDTANGVIPIADVYRLQNIMLHVGIVPLPFIKKTYEQTQREALWFFETISGENLTAPSYIKRITLYSTNLLYIQDDIFSKRVTPTITFAGTETTDWEFRTIAGTSQTGFSLDIAQADKTGIFRLVFEKISHGLTDAYFSLSAGQNGSIKIDSRL